jgi:hypothetical protein
MHIKITHTYPNDTITQVKTSGCSVPTAITAAKITVIDKCAGIQSYTVV